MASSDPRYNVYLGLKFDQFTKGANEARRVGKKIDTMLRGMERNQNNVTIGEKKLARQYRDGKISAGQYQYALVRLQDSKRKDAEKTQRLIELNDKEVRAHKDTQRAIDNRRRSLERLNREKKLNNIGNVAMAGAVTSGLGMGGRFAGAARAGAGIGLAKGMSGMATAGMAAGMVGISAGIQLSKKAVRSYAELEQQTVKLKTLFGSGVATSMIAEFKELARQTPLTTKGLIESAQVWRSYGNTTEGITKRMKAFGDISGGNAERMKLLTIAVAQVNAQGKLMGQEKNQLINAGMNLKEVAKAAGIEMHEFADAMKAGKISAEHLNTAIENMTSKGGSHFGFMEDQADTLIGKTEIMKNTFDEMFQEMGKAADKTGIFDMPLDVMTGIAGAMRDIATALADISDLEPLKDEDGKTLLDANNRIGNLGNRGLAGVESTGSDLSKDNPFYNPAYAEAVAAQQANVDRYSPAGRRKAAAEEAAIAARLKKEREARIAENKRKAAEAKEKRLVGLESDMAAGIQTESEKLQAQNYKNQFFARGQNQGRDAREIQLFYEFDQKKKELNNSDLAMEGERGRKFIDKQIAALEQVYKARVLNLRSTLDEEEKIKSLSEQQKKIKDQQKKDEAAVKGVFDQVKEDKDKEFSTRKALIEGSSLKGQNAFKGGSVEEFKFISAMKAEGEKQDALHKLQEEKKAFEEEQRTKLETKLQELQDQSDGKIEDLAGKIDTLNTTISNREL